MLFVITYFNCSVNSYLLHGIPDALIVLLQKAWSLTFSCDWFNWLKPITSGCHNCDLSLFQIIHGCTLLIYSMPIYCLLKAQYVSLMPLDFDLFLFLASHRNNRWQKTGRRRHCKNFRLGFLSSFLAVSSFLAAHPWCC